VRIPKGYWDRSKGILWDRRPATNIDPYLVTASLFVFSCLGNGVKKEMEEHIEKYTKNQR
jgi:glutamine synthetase